MKTYVYEPRDPLVLRDGRPASNGVPMRTLRFPWPSSVAGMVRTRMGQDASGAFALSKAEAKKLFNVPVSGPWLAEIGANEQVGELFFPTPMDCMWHEEKSGGTPTLVRRRLSTISYPTDGSSDLPDGLELVGPVGKAPSAKAAHAPAFFSWTALESWLARPADKTTWDRPHGLDGLPVDLRTHVAIDPQTGTAADGKLFSTEGLCFTVGTGNDTRRFGLVFGCDDTRLPQKHGPAHLGGERRLGFVRDAGTKGWPKPITVPTDARRLRLLLVTPGLFEAGYRPSDVIFGGQARVVAAVSGRPLGISGWDYAANQPKKSQRMAPAGSVYWVELSEEIDAQKFVDKWWLKSLCDEEQAQRDGFGLCLLGVNP